MRQAEKDALLTALVGKQPITDPVVRRQLDDLAVSELDAIVPVVDEMLRDRERELREPMICGHAVTYLTRMPLDDLPKIPTSLASFFIIDAKKAWRCSECDRENALRAQIVQLILITSNMVREGFMLPAELSQSIKKLIELTGGTRNGSTDKAVSESGVRNHERHAERSADAAAGDRGD